MSFMLIGIYSILGCLTYGFIRNKQIFIVAGLIYLFITLIGGFTLQQIYPTNNIWEHNQQCLIRKHYYEKYSPNGVWLEVDGTLIPMRQGESIQCRGCIKVIDFTNNIDWPKEELFPNIEP